jgi:hypothetical protein
MWDFFCTRCRGPRDCVPVQREIARWPAEAPRAYKKVVRHRISIEQVCCARIRVSQTQDGKADYYVVGILKVNRVSSAEELTSRVPP